MAVASCKIKIVFELYCFILNIVFSVFKNRLFQRHGERKKQTDTYREKE